MVAVAIGGAALIGGVTSVVSGNKSADAVRDAADRSAETERYIYDTTRADYAPWKEVGQGALGKLAGMYGIKQPGGAQNDNADPYGGFTTSPGYQFQMDEGTKAVERSAAARGGLRSGATMKALTRFAQGTAASEFNNYQSRLMQLAGIGQSATGSTAQAGQQYAAGVTNANMNAGNAQASSYANTGNAINQGVGNLASMYLYNKGYGGGR